MKVERFPQLSTLMGAWLNQDYDFDHDDEMLVIDDYARAVRANDLNATIAEVDVLLSMPTEELLARFITETGFGNMLIADDDEGARRWLSDARVHLAAAQKPAEPVHRESE